MEAKEAGKSVFLSSHILSEVERLCDKVSIIREGKIIESGTLEELRHLTRTSVHVGTAQPIESLKDLKGVHDVQSDGSEYSFQVDTEEMGEVLKHVSQFDVLKLESAPPTLEDLFLRHYRSTGGES